MENIGRELECPVCRLIPRCAPIYQCQLGHIVCSECVSQLVTCPICRTKYPKSRGRNLIAEKLLEAVDRECRYELLGCDFSSHQSSRLVEHESSCGFKRSNTPSAAQHHKVYLEGRWKKILFWTFLFLLVGFSLRSLSCTIDKTPQAKGLLVFEAIKNEEIEAVQNLKCLGKVIDIRWFKKDENSWDVWVDFETKTEMINSYDCLREKYTLLIPGSEPQYCCIRAPGKYMTAAKLHSYLIAWSHNDQFGDSAWNDASVHN